MTGTLAKKKLKSGEFFYVVLSYKDGKGKWHTKWVSTGLAVPGNKKKAKAMIPGLISKHSYLEAEMDENLGISRDILLPDYMDRWLKRKESELKQSTYEGYSYRVGRIKSYFEPKKLRLVDVTPKVLDTFYNYSLRYGKVNQKTHERGPMKPRSVRSYKSILYAVFAQAQIDGLVVANPATDVRVHGKSNRQCAEEMLFLTEEEVSDLLHFLSGNEMFERLVPVAFIAAYYGLRRSEILGLKWDAIDLAKGLIHIRHTVVRVKTVTESDSTKTVDGYRSLNLFPTAKRCLEKIKAEQEYNADYFGRDYQNEKGYIFTWEDGRCYDPDYVSKLFGKATKDFGRPEITLHKLRHSCCSLLFEKGWDLQRVQYWLGHRDAGTTLNIYAHFNRARLNGSENDLAEISMAAADLFDDIEPEKRPLKGAKSTSDHVF